MISYRKANIFLGWFSFLIASVVYLMTIEPTVSFWDCGEFIASAYKLEVGHPPGAPFFLLLARFFTLFAPDPSFVAAAVNAMSGLASAFTIMFLFWTITHLARKIIISNSSNGLTGAESHADEGISAADKLMILGAGFVGAMAYTFSDTFWFSAVEGEVYATSSLFTALVFWAILKWENESANLHAKRWLILIAYLMGLSIGVHLLNLLAIPAIVLVYYFKNYKISTKGILASLAISLGILLFIMYGIIPGVVKVASWFELLFVNGLGMPFNSGLLIYIVALVALIVWAIRHTHRKGKVILNTVIICFTVILIGYSSYSLIIIRSMADPPMNQNAPDDLFSLIYYLNREQYGQSPLIKGHYYNAPVSGQEEGAPYYSKQDGKYVVVEHRTKYEYNERFTTIFPRMYSDQAQHIEDYKQWAMVEGRPVRVSHGGETRTVRVPTFRENLRFFFRYQVGFMYLRYFMWNFAGRQNDIQGHGNNIDGNWISGLSFIDEARLGDQDNVPAVMKNNKARNEYYMLPLLLGLIGLVFHYKKHPRDFSVITLLFLMTGLAIVVYLNQYPHQPRERDYAYAGSFYAFSIWIGLGAMGLYNLLKKKIPGMVSAGLSILLCTIFVPGLMARENWDDHDRSGRYTARDFAYNYLNSCAPDAILFTNGDNDTFPLWYAQEVEGIRTDVRVANLSYMTADWYIGQLKRQAYESAPLPFSFERDEIHRGYREYLPVVSRVQGSPEISQVIDFIKNTDSKTRIQSPFRRGERVDYIPSRKVIIPVNKNKVMDEKMVPVERYPDIKEELEWSIPGRYVLKNKLMIMDLMANNEWERPVYYAITVSSDNYMNLQKFFQLEGLGYRIVPVETSERQSGGMLGYVHADVMYDNMMNKFKWGGITDPDVYLDDNNLRMLSNFRNNFATLAQSLLAQEKRDSSLKVLDKCMELMPHDRVPFDYFIVPVIGLYYQLEESGKAVNISNRLAATTKEKLSYFLSLEKKHAAQLEREIRMNFHIYQQIIRFADRHEQDELKERLSADFDALYQLFNQKFQS